MTGYSASKSCLPFVRNLFFGCLAISATISVVKAQEYNRVPSSDNAQCSECIKYINAEYEGGSLMSPYRGQTKAAAWCTCAWNETPEDFKGNLGKYAETTKGKALMKTCDQYANWGV
ncbi:MAG: hypothetical protein EBV08_05105 [Synechococcaceae bacterium WB6_1B_055]|nr:hypothetical protein [Synechococcaceae bacterium WB6_1B_055]NCU91992.1 hypothetical protein [Synechococcaceae bacterium WB7_1B_046]